MQARRSRKRQRAASREGSAIKQRNDSRSFQHDAAIRVAVSSNRFAAGFKTMHKICPIHRFELPKPSDTWRAKPVLKTFCRLDGIFCRHKIPEVPPVAKGTSSGSLELKDVIVHSSNLVPKDQHLLPHQTMLHADFVCKDHVALPSPPQVVHGDSLKASFRHG